MKKGRYWRSAVIAAAAVVCFAGAALADKLSQDDAKKALDGHTFQTHDFGEDGTLAWSGDTLTAKLQTKSDTAKVRWAEGGYCSTWTKFRSTEACFTVEKVSDTTYQLWTSDGKKDDVLTLVK
jgi:hypothetical protein